ncbi:MAG: DUF3158 family protein [Burkholderiales bacterium]|jgi:hypothetical protein|nr:DUF3158 family protein [Burkholderiales bacterium]
MTDHNPYKSLEHSASLKGFLKPFKGKGDYELLQLQARDIKRDILSLMTDLTARVNRPPYSLLNLLLWIQQSKSETWHCRWRDKCATEMGVRLWIAAVQDKRTPEALLPALLEFEQERITLNAQMSIVQHMLRQARECAGKFEEAEQVIQKSLRRKGKEQS